MIKPEAQKAVWQMLLSGYRHHSYGLEQQIREAILNGNEENIVTNLLKLDRYADVLAPNRLRALMNSLICMIALISRSAIENGVDAEQSFALSDYYINEVEKKTTESQLQDLATEILKQYGELMRKEKHRTYSLPVTRAIRYINQHLYELLQVRDIADYVNLNSQYFSTLFKKEVGVSPTVFMRHKKMDEAKKLLLQTDYSIAEIAEILGYCSSSYFIQEFKKEFGQTPKYFLKPQSVHNEASVL